MYFDQKQKDQPHHEGYTTLCALLDLTIPLLTTFSPAFFKFYLDLDLYVATIFSYDLYREELPLSRFW